MSRIAGGLILLAAIATLSAICYFQDDADDGWDTGVMPALPDIALDLRDALPSAAEVDAAFGIQEERYTKGSTWGFIGELASGRDGVDEQLAAGLVGAYWTIYSPGLGPEPEPGEQRAMIISVAMYDDARSAAEGVGLGPEMLRSRVTFTSCVESGTFARAGEANAWSADCFNGEAGGTLIQREQFVLWVVALYTSDADLPNQALATERLAQGIDFSSITSD